MKFLAACAMLLAVSAPAAVPPPYFPPAMPSPRRDALLPWNRIVTYYGNPLSKKMGILGELPPDQMMAGLQREAEAWRRADPHTRVKPGLELVATVASDYPGPSGFYRTRMPDALISKVIGWARSRGWLIILDVQVGHAQTKDEVSRLLPFLEAPDVHLALDPEFDMQPGVVPGRRIGTTDARSVNAAIAILAGLVEKKRLPPKLLLVHRFTEGMLTNASAVRLDPRVQVVMVMDGYGTPAFKRTAYRIAIRKQPVEYAGIKLFYKNDKPQMTPREALALTPGPSVVIYQ
ncbi:MAG: hypothetical protein KGL74_03105 [Elusimicrobia bacterium]|nr:hypothetical protein [Elusimicrobiota bacterium]MDE2510089.1 hypothetical protein [Elusimicrobiota bacterium]